MFTERKKNSNSYLQPQSLESLLKSIQRRKTRRNLLPLLPHVTQHSVTCLQILKVQLFLQGLNSETISILTLKLAIEAIVQKKQIERVLNHMFPGKEPMFQQKGDSEKRTHCR